MPCRLRVSSGRQWMTVVENYSRSRSEIDEEEVIDDEAQDDTVVDAEFEEVD